MTISGASSSSAADLPAALKGRSRFSFSVAPAPSCCARRPVPTESKPRTLTQSERCLRRRMKNLHTRGEFSSCVQVSPKGWVASTAKALNPASGQALHGERRITDCRGAQNDLEFYFGRCSAGRDGLLK